VNVVCEWCGKRMNRGAGCTVKTFNDFTDGIERGRIPYGSEGWFTGDVQRHCHDCKVTVGQYHHPGCDVERCPRCGEQAISCDCTESAPITADHT
jgi:hypothetical protein